MSLAILSVLVSPVAVESVAPHAAGALISGAWEGVLLAGATALLLHMVPGTTARLRFAIWTMVFLVLALLPLMSGLHSGSAAEASSGAAPLRLGARWSYALAGLWLAAVVFRLVHLGVQAVRLRRLWRSAVPVEADAFAGLELQLGRVRICTSAELDRPSVIGFFAPRILIPEWLLINLRRTNSARLCCTRWSICAAATTG